MVNREGELHHSICSVSRFFDEVTCFRMWQWYPYCWLYNEIEFDYKMWHETSINFFLRYSSFWRKIKNTYRNSFSSIILGIFLNLKCQSFYARINNNVISYYFCSTFAKVYDKVKRVKTSSPYPESNPELLDLNSV